MCLRFGLITGEANYLEDIGLLLGMSRESVRKIEKAALEKLREFIVNNNLFKTGIEYMPDGYMLYKGDTIYQEFLLYTKAEIDFAINNLSNNEQRMLHLKFGIDFKAQQSSNVCLKLVILDGISGIFSNFVQYVKVDSIEVKFADNIGASIKFIQL